MQAFLKKTAHYIHRHYNQNLSELCLVLPSRRAKLFLKNYLSEVYGKPVWAPQIFSIEDFITELSGSESIDSLTAAFEFYSVYTACEKEKAQPVDDFLQWAPTLLHDFNEIDQYLIQASSLFDYLSDERTLSLWSPGRNELSDFQKKYLLFWKSLSNYYTKFNEHLSSKKLMYSGMAYRKVAENAVELAASKNWHKIIFAGFNAINTAEIKIFKALAEAGMADILWDSDDYYMLDENQEAGKFMRAFKSSFGKYNQENKFLWQDNALVRTPKKIIIAGVAQQIGQTKVAGAILQQIAFADKTNFKHHALVLADENLLMPMLHSMPEGVDRFNVTMGYSLSHLSLNTLVDTIFSLQENAVRFGKSSEASKVRFYYRDLKKLFLHPYIEVLFNLKSENGKSSQKAARNFIHFLERENIVFIKFDQIVTYFKESDFTDIETLKCIILPWQNNVATALNSLLNLIELLRQRWNSGNKKIKSLENEILFQYTKITKRILTLLDETATEGFKEIKTIRALFNQLVKSQTIAFIGEPLEGLQVMGMLETRTLDFETVILLSANEGVLPAGKKENSFIPFELKSKFGLPTYSDKDAIFGYHFYRLLQCAGTLYLIYNTETDEFGSGEPSRYIAQLQHEIIAKNKNVIIEERLYTIPINTDSIHNAIEIQKNNFVLQRLKQLCDNGLSPSLLNSYRNCSLQFYFKHIAKIEENDEPEESIDAATFGTVIHSVLEECLTPFIGKTITSVALKKSFGDIKSKVESAFRAVYKSGELHDGKNLLNLKVAEKYLTTFLKVEIDFIEKLASQSKMLEILELEKELNSSLNSNGNTIHLKGKVDRIDKSGDTIRIIDYKTGAVNENKELKLKDWDDLKEVARNKSFQLLLYAYLYHKNHNLADVKISAGIISFRELSKGLKPVTFNGNNELDAAVLSEFEMELKLLIEKIIDPKLKFEQTTDLDICGYCSFNRICNR